MTSTTATTTTSATCHYSWQQQQQQQRQHQKLVIIHDNNNSKNTTTTEICHCTWQATLNLCYTFPPVRFMTNSRHPFITPANGLLVNTVWLHFTNGSRAKTPSDNHTLFRLTTTVSRLRLTLHAERVYIYCIFIVYDIFPLVSC